MRASDLRDSELYREALAAHARHALPGSGAVVDAQHYDVDPSGKMACFEATMFDRLEGRASTRLCTVGLDTGDVRIRSHGSSCDSGGRWSPDGGTIAFLSDRTHGPGVPQLHWLDTRLWRISPGPTVAGFVEACAWSGDARHVLLRSAGADSDLAGAQGGYTAHLPDPASPAWLPEVDDGDDASRRRRLWIVDRESGRTSPLGPPALNVWDACWWDDDVMAVASADGSESAWYDAALYRCTRNSEAVKLYVPKRQIGCIAAAPKGGSCAFVEGLASDRMLVAGEVMWIPAGSTVARPLALPFDATHLAFVGPHTLMIAGYRSFETVLARVDLALGAVEEIWCDAQRTFGSYLAPEFAPLPDGRSVVTTVEGFVDRATITRLGPSPRPLASLGGLEESARSVACVLSTQAVQWQAPDGLEVHGWLIRPVDASSGSRQPRPTALMMDVHGGPVWQWRPRWLGASPARQLLLERGIAVFLPNPRGSSGRGQAYAERVLGDMGGADVHDYLSGVDHLLDTRIADPNRLYLMGGSYGGYMTSWLVTQDNRFSAAVANAPVTDWTSEHLVCHIPRFCELFLDDDWRRPDGRYRARSPVYFADRVRTPLLLVAGARDHNTPPGQAIEFHRALRQAGARSALALYPGEGHNVRSYPALIDHTARLVGWIDRHPSV